LANESEKIFGSYRKITNPVKTLACSTTTTREKLLTVI